jgi:hypothetical protein
MQHDDWVTVYCTEIDRVTLSWYFKISSMWAYHTLFYCQELSAAGHIMTLSQILFWVGSSVYRCIDAHFPLEVSAWQFKTLTYLYKLLQ